MSQGKWKELNNLPTTSLYIEFPVAFTGKKASAFAGLTLSCQFVLAYIHTMNKIFGGSAKLTYDKIIQTFGMSRETVSAAITTLIERKIIKREKQSCYVIVPRYLKCDYVKIDMYWLRHEWEVNGENKRFARSRLLTLALLKRSCENKDKDGIFVSSQARIGKAVNLPRTTAGDSVRELIAAGLVQSEKADGNDRRKRGCSLFTVNPAIMNVKLPNRLDSGTAKKMAEAESSADTLHKRFMLDEKYRKLNERIERNDADKIQEIIHSCGEETEKLAALNGETVRLRVELDEYFKTHKVNRKIFPPGFFKCDKIENSDN